MNLFEEAKKLNNDPTFILNEILSIEEKTSYPEEYVYGLQVIEKRYLFLAQFQDQAIEQLLKTLKKMVVGNEAAIKGLSNEYDLLKEYRTRNEVQQAAKDNGYNIEQVSVFMQSHHQLVRMRTKLEYEFFNELEQFTLTQEGITQEIWNSLKFVYSDHFYGIFEVARGNYDFRGYKRERFTSHTQFLDLLSKWLGGKSFKEFGKSIVIKKLQEFVPSHKKSLKKNKVEFPGLLEYKGWTDKQPLLDYRESGDFQNLLISLRYMAGVAPTLDSFEKTITEQGFASFGFGEEIPLNMGGVVTSLKFYKNGKATFTFNNAETAREYWNNYLS